MANDFTLETFLPFRLNVLAQEVSTRLSEIYAKRFNLDIPQWRILANLASRGDMTAHDIGRVAFTHKSTISRAVAELEKRKLISRVTDPDDGRAFTLRLTGKGQILFKSLLPHVLAFETSLLAKMKASEATALLKGLDALESAVLTKSST